MGDLRIEVWDYKSGNRLINTASIATALAAINVGLNGDANTLVMGIWHDNKIVVRFEGQVLQDMVDGIG